MIGEVCCGWSWLTQVTLGGQKLQWCRLWSKKWKYLCHLLVHRTSILHFPDQSPRYIISRGIPIYLRLTIQKICPCDCCLRSLQILQPPLLCSSQEGHLDHDALQSQVSERGVHWNPLPLEVDGERSIRRHRALETRSWFLNQTESPLAHVLALIYEPWPRLPAGQAPLWQSAW